MPHLSIVTSLCRSEKFLEEFVEKCLIAIQQIGIEDFEIIMVNDGSPDNSLEESLRLKKKVPQIKVINLSRNFGHHYAFFAGMTHAKGEYIFNIDCDLEVNPLVLVDFYQEITENNSFDVVYGFQSLRKGRFTEKYFGGLFWKLFNYLSNTKIPSNVITERIMKRAYVNELVHLGDKTLFLAGLMYWVGFNQKGLPIDKGMRKGKSTYTFFKRHKLLIDAVSSFSAYPLKLLSYVGTILMLISFLYGTYLIIRKLVEPSMVLMGYTSLLVVILFSTGIIIASLGLIGIYLEKLFNQAKNRPLFIIKEIF